MTKRLLLVAVLAASFGVVAAAHAGCPGASAGHRGGATVPATEVGGTRTVTVTIEARWVDACDDGTLVYNNASSDKIPVPVPVPIVGAPTRLTITGDQSCTADTTSDWDPFGFAVGVHDTGDTAGNPHPHRSCNIDISWSGVGGVYLPDPERSGPTGNGVRVTASKATNNENGVVFVDGVEYRAHGAGIGVMWTGVGGDA